MTEVSRYKDIFLVTIFILHNGIWDYILITNHKNLQNPLFLYFYYIIFQSFRQLHGFLGGDSMTALKVGIKSLEVPLPPLETQRAIVAEIEAEQSLVAANRELIARMEKKVKAVIERVWGEEDSGQ
jgi:restriction endonuclease S subunit